MLMATNTVSFSFGMRKWAYSPPCSTPVCTLFRSISSYVTGMYGRIPTIYMVFTAGAEWPGISADEFAADSTLVGLGEYLVLTTLTRSLQ